MSEEKKRKINIRRAFEREGGKDQVFELVLQRKRGAHLVQHYQNSKGRHLPDNTLPIGTHVVDAKIRGGRQPGGAEYKKGNY